MKPIRLMSQIVAVPCKAVLLMFALYSGAAGTEPSAVQTTGDNPLPPRLPLNELRIFVQAFDQVSDAYVEEIDDRTPVSYTHLRAHETRGGSSMASSA